MLEKIEVLLHECKIRKTRMVNGKWRMGVSKLWIEKLFLLHYFKKASGYQLQAASKVLKLAANSLQPGYYQPRRLISFLIKPNSLPVCPFTEVFSCARRMR